MGKVWLSVPLVAAISIVAILAAGCATTGDKLPARMSKEKIRSLSDSVFEVVIPKIENKAVAYHDTVPKEQIPIQFRNSPYLSVGTAFAVTPNRFVSAAHVFEIEKFAVDPRVFVRDSEGNVHEVDKIFRYSTHRDIVVFSTKTLPKKVLPLDISSRSEVGDVVYTVGNAYGEGISFREGQIANYTPEPHKGAWKFIRYTAAASPGNSGGPLLNTKGEVLGIVTMKNESENLNFAVPVAEMRKVSRKRAEFFNPINPVTTPTGRQNVVLKFSLKIPAPIEKLGEDARRARERFWVQTWRKIYAATAKQRFPLDPDAASWLRRQEYASVLSFVGKNEQGFYEMETREGAVVPRVGGDQLRFTYEGDDLTLFNYVPSREGSHARYIANPELILDGVIESQGWARDVAGQMVRIATLGPPAERTRFEDSLGRPWMVAKWRTHFDFLSHVLNCVPVPKGFSCLFYSQPTLEENTGFQYRFERLDAPEMALSFSGTVKQWLGYQKLDPKWVPEVIRGGRVLSQGQQITAAIGPFSSSVTDPLASLDSYVFVGVGFRASNPRQAEVHGLRFSHGPKQENSQEFFPAFAPSGKVAQEEKSLWDTLLKSSGFAAASHNSKELRLIVDQRGLAINPTAPQAYSQVFEFSCRAASVVSADSCQKFIRNTSLGRLAH